MFFPQLPYFLGDNDSDDDDDDDDEDDDDDRDYDDDDYDGNDFFNYLFVNHFVVYLLIQSTVLPFLLSYDLISLNFKTRPKITSLACLLYAASHECIGPQ